MACKSCRPLPQPPIYRSGLPTIWAHGPFPDHEVVDYTGIDNGYLHEEQQEEQQP